METLVRAFLTVLQAQERYAYNTILGYQNDLQHFSKYLYHHLGRIPDITDFNPDQIFAYLKSCAQVNKLSTIKRRMATLKTFSSFLQRSGEIKAFNFPAVDQIYLTANDAGLSEKITRLSEAQVIDLTNLVKADPRPQARRDEAILRLILEVGLSVSRLSNLNLSDFDSHGFKLQLKKSTGDNWWVSIEKSGPILKQYLQEGRPELNPSTGETAFFISQMGRRVSRQGIWQICQRWGERMGLSDGLSPRILRHTAVYHMVQAGKSENNIQEILEHHNLAATQGLLQRIREA